MESSGIEEVQRGVVAAIGIERTKEGVRNENCNDDK